MAYLYNGVRLPKLPEWDKKAYPSAVISMTKQTLTNRYNPAGLYLLPELIVEMSDSGIFHITTGAVGAIYARVDVDNDGNSTEMQWPDFTPCSEQGNIALGNVRWTDTDIYKPDGSLYMAASEPIPAYE